MTPRSVPKRPKIVPRRLQDGLAEMFFRIDFYHRFRFVLGPILALFGLHFGSQNRSFFGSFF